MRLNIWLKGLPKERKDKALHYRREIDRKTSVISYLLLDYALFKEYNMRDFRLAYLELTVCAKNLYANVPAVRCKVGKQVTEIIYRELHQNAVNTAGFLLDPELPKKHIASLEPASYAWVVAYHGVAFAGTVVIFTIVQSDFV